MPIQPLPVVAFLAGGALVSTGVLAALEIASALGALVMCATLVGLVVRT